jgi:histidinol-phosphate aminotransferase
MPIPRPAVLTTPAYPLPERTVPGSTGLIHLASNECASDPSPLAVQAYCDAAASLRVYPDAGAGVLREALAKHYDLDAERIVCGAGSEELIYLLAQAYCGPGDEVIIAQYGYLLFNVAARLAGAIPVFAIGSGLAPDVDAMAAVVTPRTRLLLLANPNNPTGHCLTRAAIEALRRNLPDDVLLVLDAAYAEYVTRDDYEAGFVLAARAPNVVVLRTFSKVYGLAGVRIGWAYAPAAVADVLHRVRPPANVSGPAQAAAAAALVDQAHVSRVVRENACERARFSRHLQQLGLNVTPSEGNFVLAQFRADLGQSAAAAYVHLKSRGIIARPMNAYGLNDCLRFTIGTPENMNAAVKALKSFCQDAARTVTDKRDVSAHS